MTASLPAVRQPAGGQVICGSVRPRSGSAAVGEMLSSKTEEQVGPSTAKLFDAQRSELAPKNDAEIQIDDGIGCCYFGDAERDEQMCRLFRRPLESPQQTR